MFPRFKNHVTRDLSRHTKWSRIISRLSNYKSENKKIKRRSNENLHSWKLESLKNNPSPLQNASQLNLTQNFLSQTSNSEKERKKKNVSNNFSIHQDPKNRRKLPTLPISRNRLISRHHKFHPASRNNKRSGIYHGEKERVERFGKKENTGLEMARPLIASHLLACGFRICRVQTRSVAPELCARLTSNRSRPRWRPRWFENNCFPAYEHVGRRVSDSFSAVWSGCFALVVVGHGLNGFRGDEGGILRC